MTPILKGTASRLGLSKPKIADAELWKYVPRWIQDLNCDLSRPQLEAFAWLARNYGRSSA